MRNVIQQKNRNGTGTNENNEMTKKHFFLKFFSLMAIVITVSVYVLYVGNNTRCLSFVQATAVEQHSCSTGDFSALQKNVPPSQQQTPQSIVEPIEQTIYKTERTGDRELLNLIEQTFQYVKPLYFEQCELHETLIERYYHLRDAETRVFIALNLHDSQDVTPNLIRELVRFALFLDKRVFISVYESGSKDLTHEILKDLKEILDDNDIPNRVLSQEKQIKWHHVHRIETLASLRNIVLQPLHEPHEPNFDHVLFVNDIFVCAGDMLELIHQRVYQEADVTCGGDYVGHQKHTFYDMWVMKDITGFPPMEYLNSNMNTFFSRDPISQERFRTGLPLQVWGCWNGMVALTPQPFITNNLRFRSGDPNVECSASECTHLFVDLYRLGYNRVVMVPLVKVTYHPYMYHELHTFSPALLPISVIYNNDYTNYLLEHNEPPPSEILHYYITYEAAQPEYEMVQWRETPERVVCIPFPEGVGNHHANWGVYYGLDYTASNVPENVPHHKIKIG